MADLIKWSQWSDTEGMIRCGHAELSKLREWMKELAKDAKKCLKAQDKPHAIFGREIHDGDGNVVEVRFYCDCYRSDEELKKMTLLRPQDFFWAVHKRG